MAKILFVNPSAQNDFFSNVPSLRLPPLNLAMLAGLTPEKFEMEIIDEAISPVTFSEDADLVAVTAMTTQAPRAYEICAGFGRRGVPVVMGGIHASMMPEEAARFADAVVVGEAEEAWQTLISDWEQHKLKPRYTSEPPSLAGLPLPRRDLLGDGYFIETVQTSRGCPFDCRFCSVSRFNGRKYRHRPIRDVIEEITILSGDRFFFMDDNIIGFGEKSTQRAFDLFEALRPLNKQWASQTCINIVENEKLLGAASQAGAMLFFIGFESLDESSLRLMNKKVNLRPATRDFKAAIRKIHDHGIIVVGGMILGFDTDTSDTIERTIEFANNSGLDGIQLSVQTPFPGTALFEQLQAEKRLVFDDSPDNWSSYTGFNVVFQPKNMSVDALREAYFRAIRKTTTLRQTLPRLVRSYWHTRSVLGSVSAFQWSRGANKLVRDWKA